MAGKKQQRQRAIAIKYDPKVYEAPKVVASGAGVVADHILELAHEHNVPIHEDKDLVTLLAQLDIGAIIPPELYSAVAEVLAFVYRLKIAKEMKQDKQI